MAEEGTVPVTSTVVPTDISQHLDPRLTSMFVKPEGMVGVQSTFTHTVEPLTGTDEEYVFKILHTGSSYADLKNTQLYIKGNLTRCDGTKLLHDEVVLVANNFLYNLFEFVTLCVGNNQQIIFHTKRSSDS